MAIVPLTLNLWIVLPNTWILLHLCDLFFVQGNDLFSELCGRFCTINLLLTAHNHTWWSKSEPDYKKILRFWDWIGATASMLTMKFVLQRSLGYKYEVTSFLNYFLGNFVLWYLLFLDRSLYYSLLRFRFLCFQGRGGLMMEWTALGKEATGISKCINH